MESNEKPKTQSELDSEIPTHDGTWWWSIRRFFVQIIGVSVVLEQIVHHVVEKQRASLVERLHFRGTELVLWIAEVFVSFLLGSLIEKRIDDWTLESYKRTLLALLGDRFSTLWGNYNLLLKMYAVTRDQEVELKRRLEGSGGHDVSPAPQ